MERPVLAGVCALALAVAARGAVAQVAPWAVDAGAGADASAGQGADAGAGASGDAASAGVDEVVLRDGTRVEGRAVSVRLGEQVTMRAPDGALRVLLWAEIQSARGPSFDAAASGAAAPRVPPPLPEAPGRAGVQAGPGMRLTPGPLDPFAGAAYPPGFVAPTVDVEQVTRRYLAPSPGTVRVGLASDGEPVQISAIVDAFGESRAAPGLAPGGNAATMSSRAGIAMMGLRLVYLCTTPCTLHLRPGDATLHVGGTGVLESVQSLRVPPGGARVVLRSPSSAVFAVGVVATSFGGAMLLGGVIMLAFEAATAGSPTLTRGSGGSALVAGLVLLGGGGALLAGGVYAFARSPVGIARWDAVGAGASRRRPTWSAGVAPAGDGGAFGALTLAF